ncbi:MAG: CxxC-x17-CxxC domain-containing protein [bacterium]
MKDFDRYAKFSKRDSGRDSGRFGGRDSGRRSFEKQMHEATCDKCGKQCEVPFKPTEGKPVYCSDCFEKTGNSSRYGDRDSRRPDRGGYNRSGGRDSGRFSSRDSGSNKPDQFIKEFDQLNRKLDTILKALEVPRNEQVVEKPVKEPKKTEIKVEKKKIVKKKEQPKAKKKKAAAKKPVKKSG